MRWERRFGYAGLHRDLVAGGNDSGLLGADRVWLLPDRTLSPAGDRRFKDLRVPSEAQGGWPNPGIYSIPDFAERLLIETERALQTRLRKPLLDPLEFLSFALEGNEGNPFDALRKLKRTREFFKMGLAGDEWTKVLEDYESDASPELTSTTLDLLFHLGVRAAVSRHWASPWEAVEEAIKALPLLTGPAGPGSGLWARAAERPPGTPVPSFVVPAYRELQPLERRFLIELARHVPVLSLEPEPDDASLPRPELARAFPSGEAGEALHWAYRVRRPSALEVLELLPGDFALDVPEPPPSPRVREARAFELWARYTAEGRPSEHPFLYGDQASRLLILEGFDPEGAPSLASLCDWLAARRPSSAAALREIGARYGESPPARLSPWVRAFAELHLFEREDADPAPTLEHPRRSLRGLPVLSLEDLPLSGCARSYLWSSPEELHEALDPASYGTLSMRAYPPRFLDALARQGVSLPDPSREASMLASLLRERLREEPGSVALLAAPPRAATPAPRVQRLAIRDPLPVTGALSPTGLETYLRCPSQFYLGRVLRLGRDEEWDPEVPNARAKGSWIHRVLELALAEGGSPDETWFRERLLEHLPVYFERATPSYRELLGEQARLDARRLRDHFEVFERPLALAAPKREIRREHAVEASAFGRAFRGRVDRWETLPGAKHLLWDYKTGKVKEARASTLLQKGRVQWFLYRELLELPAGASGGGYLNPLEPSVSRLLFPKDGFPELESFFEAAAKAGYPITWLDAKAEDEARAALTTTVVPALEALARGEFPAEPREDSDCQRCDYRAHCGRPYLVQEDDR
jgi:hypothetical protein